MWSWKKTIHAHTYKAISCTDRQTDRQLVQAPLSLSNLHMLPPDILTHWSDISQGDACKVLDVIVLVRVEVMVGYNFFPFRFVCDQSSFCYSAYCSLLLWQKYAQLSIRHIHIVARKSDSANIALPLAFLYFSSFSYPSCWEWTRLRRRAEMCRLRGVIISPNSVASRDEDAQSK